MFPPFDFLNPDIWGPITGFLATFIGALTVLYFYRRTREIRVADVYPWWVWPAWTAYSNGLLVGSFFFRDRLPFASTFAGLLAGIPMLVVGVKLMRRHRAR